MDHLHPEYRKRVVRIAQHEMGHFVACRHFGFRTGDVSVQVDSIGGGHRGGASMVLTFAIRSVADVDEYLCRRTVVLYAGALSETLFLGAPVKAISEANQRDAVRIIEDPSSGAHIDHAKIRELRGVLRNLRHPDTPADDLSAIHAELEQIDSELWRRTIEVVDKYYMTILGLADNLTQQVKMTGDEGIMTATALEALPYVQAIAAV